MYNRRYDKVFLMLRQETAGYAIGRRMPWGSCIMELKNGMGRLMLTVQGLRPHCYTVYALAGEESLFCGEMHPEGQEGQCTLQWDFHPDALGESGATAEDLHTVVLLAEDGMGGYSAPLTAYFGEKRDWRAILKPREKRQTEPPKQTELPKQTEPLKQTEKPMTESYHGSFQGLLAKFRQELEHLEETGVLTAAETKIIHAAGDAGQITQEQKNMDASCDAMHEVVEEGEQETEKSERQADSFGQNRELEPFGDGVPWKCLFLEELTLLSQIPLRWQKEFFFLLPYRRYHHLILRQAENGYWLGLPGAYSAEEEREAQTFGFREFRRVEADWGYWMAFLERRD